MDLTAKQLKVAGLVLLLVPAGLLVLFIVGETVGGDISGLSHLIQLAPLVIVAVVAWMRPRLGGAILLAVGLGLAIAYPLLARGQAASATLAAEAILFLPAMLSGLLFLAAGRKQPGAA